MEGYLIFDTLKGRMINVYHAKTYEAALEAKACIKGTNLEFSGAVTEVTILHLETVPCWEAKIKRDVKKPTIDRLWRERLKREGSENGKGTKEI